MKKLIATVIVVGGVLLGSGILRADDAQERIVTPAGVEVAQLDEGARQTHIWKAMARISEEIRKKSQQPVYENPRRYDRAREEKYYDNRAINLEFKKEISLEGEFSRGASASFALDSMRRLERVGFGASYGQASIKVSHNIKSDTGFVNLSVGRETGLEMILNKYTEPVFKGRAKIGSVGSVSAYYDTCSRNFLSNGSFSYKGASLVLNYMPQQRTANATLSYNLPAGYNSVFKNLTVTHTYANGVKLNSYQASGSLGPVNFSAGTNNSSGKYNPIITFSYSKKF